VSFSVVRSFILAYCYHCFEGTYCFLLRIVKVEDDAAFLWSKSVKVKFALEQTTKAHSGNRGIALLFI